MWRAAATLYTNAAASPPIYAVSADAVHFTLMRLTSARDDTHGLRPSRTRRGNEAAPTWQFADQYAFRISVATK